MLKMQPHLINCEQTDRSVWVLGIRMHYSAIVQEDLMTSRVAWHLLIISILVTAPVSGLAREFAKPMDKTFFSS